MEVDEGSDQESRHLVPLAGCASAFEECVYGRWKSHDMFPIIYSDIINWLVGCVDVLRPSQQLRSCGAGQIPINTVPSN